MQERPENNENFASDEQKLSREEAEAKVAEMFAAAKTSSKRDKKKEKSAAHEEELSAPEQESSYEEDDEESPGLFSLASLNKLRKQDDSDDTFGLSELTEQKLTPEEAEEKIASVFAAASAKNPNKSKGSSTSAFGLELALLESLSFFLFIASMRSGIPGAFSPVAIFLPVILGVGYRMICHQFSLLEALSKCKPHIFISAFFYLCLLISI